MRQTSGLLFTTTSRKPGILVREAVVVLPPDGRGDQQVERRDRRPPRQLAADRQPLGVLVEHRVDDVDEGFVGREEAVAAGEQVAFEPALERVLARASPGRGRRATARRRRRPPAGSRPARASCWPRRSRRACWRCSRPGRRRGSSVMFWRMMSRRKLAERPRVLGRDLSRACRPRWRSRGSRACAAACRSRPPLACGLALMRRVPFGASALSSGISRPLLVEQLLGLVAAQPVFELLAGAPGSRARPRAAPGGRARSLRPCGRPLPSGRSSPWACAARSSASAAASACRCCAPPAGCAGSPARTPPASRPSSGACAAGSSPSTKCGVQP